MMFNAAAASIDVAVWMTMLTTFTRLIAIIFERICMPLTLLVQDVGNNGLAITEISFKNVDFEVLKTLFLLFGANSGMKLDLILQVPFTIYKVSEDRTPATGS
jgi:hypothetical protein